MTERTYMNGTAFPFRRGEITMKKMLSAVPAGIAVAVLASTLAGAPVFAQGTPTPPSKEQQEPAYACTTKVPSGMPDSGLKSLAKISETQARSAATTAVPGTVVKVDLENENGCAVYGVEIKTADGKVHDVKVDAGTAAVVHQEIATKAGVEHEGGSETENGTED